MGLVQARQDLLASRIGALKLPAGLQAARADALARLMAMGLPGKRDEYWRYTDPASLNSASAAPAVVFDAGDESPVFGAIDALKLVFVDGVFDPAASDDPALVGVEITLLSDTKPGHWAESAYGTLESRGQTPVSRPFATLNTVFADSGVLIRATGQASRPVSLIYIHTSDTSDATLHHYIKIGPNAQLTLLESGPVAARVNLVLEVDLAEGARFQRSIGGFGPMSGLCIRKQGDFDPDQGKIIRRRRIEHAVDEHQFQRVYRPENRRFVARIENHGGRS